MHAGILVVEDELAIQELVAANLEQSGFQVIRANDAEQAMREVQRKAPDLVVLDWGLPGASGIDFAKRLRADIRTRQVPIIMLTARAEEQDRLVAFESGADDYITKPFSVRELNARVRAVLRRQPPSETVDVIDYHGLRITLAEQRVVFRNAVIEMGLTEFRLLHFFALRPDRVFTRHQIIQNIWGDGVEIEERTIDVHIRRLRLALEKHALDGFVQTVRGTGYRFSHIGA